MSNLYWKKNGKNVSLLSDGRNDLVYLSSQADGKSIFSISGVTFQIKLQGFWMPKYIITSNDETILTVNHNFWGSTGFVIFNDGSTFQSKYSNKSLLSLAYFENEVELLSYKFTIADKKMEVHLNIGTAMLDADKMLILSTLGYVIFSSMLAENYQSGVITTIIN